MTLRKRVNEAGGLSPAQYTHNFDGTLINRVVPLSRSSAFPLSSPAINRQLQYLPPPPPSPGTGGAAAVSGGAPTSISAALSSGGSSGSPDYHTRGQMSPSELQSPIHHGILINAKLEGP